MNRLAGLLGAFTLLLALGCPPEHLTREEIYSPDSCVDCHSTHVDEWAMSMHAYAADDPVFLAMNRRGQEETNGELGTFCVNCHAPLAVELGEVEDGLELEDPNFPDYLKGVNCAFCHLASHSDGDSNNPIDLAGGRTLFGPFDDPTKNGAHNSAYSPMLDRNRRESTELCGPCHDIVLDNGVHLEQTFAEWNDTVFATPEILSTCGNCHMTGSNTNVPIADVDGVPARQHHDHTMPGVDVAIIPFVNNQQHEERVQSFLETTVRTEICVNSEPPAWEVLVGLENVSAGHSFPSGSSHDRRVWAEIRAYQGDDLIFESGAVPEGVPATDIINEDSQGILLRDTVLDAEGEEVHMFWDIDQEPVRNVLNGIRVFGLEEIRTWSFRGPVGTEPDRIELRVYERAIALEVLDDLVETGHLDSSLRQAMPTLELTGAQLEWTGPPLGTCVSTGPSPN